MKKTIILFCMLASVQFLQAQSPMLDSARNEIYRINRVFDSSMYLGFNMDIGYRADSSNVTIETEQMSGTYVLNKKNLYYNMGGTEYIQTDSFSYTIYGDTRMMIMARNAVRNNSELLPLKTYLDSVLNYYGNAFTITIDTVHIDSADYVKRILFTIDSVGGNSDTITNCTSFFIEYDEGSYLPSKFNFSYKEDAPVYVDDTVFSGYIKLVKHVNMNFSSYKAFTNTEVFNDVQYMIYNRQRKIYEPADKYKNYQFITTGFENEEADN